MGLFDRFKKGLQKSRTTLAERLGSVFRSRKLDESVYEEMEEAFIAADMGVETAMALVENVRTLARKKRIEQAEELPDLMVEAMSAMLSEADSDMNFAAEGPTLVLVVGVNGAGKTTTIGKLANYYLQQNKRVLLAAADTFRAAAIEQLLAWGERAGCDVVRHSQGADPAAVIYDAIQAGRSRNADIILCDTAGRLQNKTHLMAELAKIHKVAARELPGSPHEVLLVLDGTTGQNGLNQAKVFKEVVDVTGIVVTKLDGTAKGGIVVPIVHEQGIPVKWIGLGEQIDDLQPFDARAFAEAVCRP
ncbi:MULTISPECIES: signal recognition particle-docking protein FtsY [Alicyclobacillus]|uniref:Signal recognition particle receptor FtsY n=1 Tax=Alicyclobacillus acidoterrestris (strain ATCC 49025 / DSM 3922 / CIP 106132 / NCIMB 13137 / GD3B) TaxID=1356854 RepID=T0CFK0_ALIAG|nr:MULTISPECIES: signal recognition particle-docking protein FtsY [Alicyclobacillus]EPZ51589.1 cell division protein FtsY [Alicyclobacillus acidoterrestris ATCC 49025]UNO50646.1 signal recognition particle-docking protein FtsY [Alicyclobacillus acidoterrestris]